MSRLTTIVLLSGLICLLNTYSFSQDAVDSTYYIVITNDGNEYIGQIISREEESITILTKEVGQVKIFTQYIVSIKEVKSAELKEGKYYFENPQATRYFWAPNGYGLKKGEAYYQNVWIFFNQASVGISDYFSLGAGIVPAFIFAGAPTPVWVTPKFSIPVVKDKLNIGAGVLAGTVLGEGSSFGIAYGSITVGPKDNNVSLGLGYGFADGEWATSPAINISGMFRISPKTYLITENYYLGFADEGLGIISFGGRKIIKKLSLDFGGFIPIQGDIPFLIIPWLGISIPVGKYGKNFNE